MQEVLIFASILAPIILAFTEVAKRTITFPANYVPVVALALGLVIGFFGDTFSDLPLEHRLWAGALAALSATGIFELFTNSPGNTDKKVVKK